MGKDDCDSNSLDQAPSISANAPSPSWSPIPPLSEPSTSNHDLLNSILLDSGIYDPRVEAEKPKSTEFWERSTSSSDATFTLPAVLPDSTISNKRRNETIRGKRAPRKTAGASSKASHLVWIEDQGLPDLQSKLTIQKHLLEEVTQDLANLDHQMRAIKIMRPRE